MICIWTPSSPWPTHSSAQSVERPDQWHALVVLAPNTAQANCKQLALLGSIPATLRTLVMAAAGAPTVSPEDLDAIWRDLKNWNGGIYSCKEDPRFFVPKSPYRVWSWGWTINLGHENAEIAILGGVMAVIAAMEIAKRGNLGWLGGGFGGWHK